MSFKDLNLDTPPAELFRRIQARFRELGIFGQRLTLTHQGRRYLANCDEHSFIIYQVHDDSHLPPGTPGWPVCLVTNETASDETSPPHHEPDDFSSGLTLHDWLQLIDKNFG